MGIMSKFASLLRRTNIVAQGDENRYYAWADARLDEIAAERTRQAAARQMGMSQAEVASLRKNLRARGYELAIYVNDDGTVDEYES